MRRARFKPEVTEQMKVIYEGGESEKEEGKGGKAEEVEFVEEEREEEESVEEESVEGEGVERKGEVVEKRLLYVIGTAYTCLDDTNAIKAAAFIEKYAKCRKVIFYLGQSLSTIVMSKVSKKGNQSLEFLQLFKLNSQYKLLFLCP